MNTKEAGKPREYSENWTIKRDDEETRIEGGGPTTRYTVAVCYGLKNDTRLIAAAPSLLSALKGLVSRHPEPCGFTITETADTFKCGGDKTCRHCAPVFAAREAIAKAEGK